MPKSTPASPHTTEVTFLGGLEEVGMNALLLSYGPHRIMVDCGIGFPDPVYYPGVDFAHPDFSVLRRGGPALDGIVTTHGHEDHIGAISLLLKDYEAPVYAMPFTVGLIKNRLQEMRQSAEINTVRPGRRYEIGPFRVEWIPIPHSIPDSCCLFIETPDLRILHSGDFKLALQDNVTGGETLRRLGAIAHEGVDLLFCESTNVFRPGAAPSEETLRESFEKIFRQASGRIFLVVFSTHIERIRTALEVGRQFRRRIMLAGRSLERNVQIARDHGYLRFKPGEWADLPATNTIPHSQQLIITTGSQAEPMAAISRMMRQDHRTVTLEEGDTVIWSARRIPGNENAIAHVVDQLTRQGAEVFLPPLHHVHASGHGYRGDIEFLLKLIKPRFLIPVHGQHHFLAEHYNLAIEAGLGPDQVFVCQNGDVLRYEGDTFQRLSSHDAKPVYLSSRHGITLNDDVFRERRALARHGHISFQVLLDEDGDLVCPPTFKSMGTPATKQELNEEWPESMEEILYSCSRRELESPHELSQTLLHRFRLYVDNVWGFCPRIQPFVTVLE